MTADFLHITRGPNIVAYISVVEGRNLDICIQSTRSAEMTMSGCRKTVHKKILFIGFASSSSYRSHDELDQMFHHSQGTPFPDRAPLPSTPFPVKTPLPSTPFPDRTPLPSTPFPDRAPLPSTPFPDRAPPSLTEHPYPAKKKDLFLETVECVSLSVENTNKQFILPTAQTKMFEDISFVCTSSNLWFFDSHRQGAYCMMNS